MAFSPTNPDSTNLCGEFTDPTTRDPGEAFSAPIRQSCEAPTDEIADDIDVVFVNGQPVFAEAGAIDTGTGVSYPEFDYTGELTDETIFGGFEAVQACAITGLQLVVETEPSGDDIDIVLVDGNDAEIAGTTATLPANTDFSNTEFATPVTLIAGDQVRAKVKNTGTTVVGGYLTVRLIIGPAS